MSSVSMDIQQIFDRGGRELIDLLEHCVLAINTDALLLYLIREYRLQPRADAAIAMHDLFCVVGAPAQISMLGMISPKDMRLSRAVDPLRRPSPVAPVQQTDAALEVDSDQFNPQERSASHPAAVLPAKYLFDSIAQQLNAGTDSKIALLQQSYCPDRTPLENLPGGQLTAAQRAFVDNRWKPLIRPHLVAVGFWRLSTVA
ncbi:hypothetical protein NHH03_07325 [Stieleria sp. TO1_6]|uniref:hypothetical protein n=1 Tax=Stieleria tagensis TaxID=2956795 RepID=UPI00209BA598|nr:hypothetical protein [Stieleria tagensis]MCO8121541.1 hypothetical protein [Stieleria tagensis]